MKLNENIYLLSENLKMFRINNLRFKMILLHFLLSVCSISFFVGKILSKQSLKLKELFYFRSSNNNVMLALHFTNPITNSINFPELLTCSQDIGIKRESTALSQ